MEHEYSFNKQLKKGENEEFKLDKFFSDDYYICPVTMELQKNGIDRIFVKKTDFSTYKIEYKSDFKTHLTGNVFIETCSICINNNCNVRGWAYTSKADFLIYLVVKKNIAYIISMNTIKKNINHWKSIYKKRSSPNKGYKTVGILVPLNDFKSKTERIIRID